MLAVDSKGRWMNLRENFNLVTVYEAEGLDFLKGVRILPLESR